MRVCGTRNHPGKPATRAVYLLAAGFPTSAIIDAVNTMESAGVELT